jgi:hypothetical protein
VPLFVEELTKAVLEAGAQAPATLSSMPHPPLSVPATLHASLMARLDRLGSAAREIAQAGAAIGREFGHALLAAITDLPELQVNEALDRLTSAGLVFARGTPPEASYLFKHALVQDAAYGSLLRSRRQSLHRRIVSMLEERFPEVVQGQPALLARHSQEAGLTEQAVVYRLKAGQQALTRSAMVESVVQLRKGLDVLAGLPDGLWRRQQELALLTVLGSALTATKGYSAPDVGETLARARALAEQLPLLVPHWTFHNVRAEYRLALPLAQQLEAIGEAQNNAAAQLRGRLFHAFTRLLLGELVAARALLERCIGLDDPTYRTSGGLTFDAYTAMLTYLALTLAYQGFIDQGRSRMDEALSKARQLRHAFTIAHVLFMATWLDWVTGTPMVHLEESQALASEHGFPFFSGWALACRGQSLVALGHAQEGLALLTQGVAKLRLIGSRREYADAARVAC